MRLSVICFTGKGHAVMEEVIRKLSDVYDIEPYCKCRAMKDITPYKFASEHISIWSKAQFEKRNALLFIGSVGIAVRGIAGSVKDKLTDSPVLVMDDNAKFVIPVLSGHVGGANEIALKIQERIGPAAVITTSTDVNNTFSVDVFASKNHMKIKNRGGIVLVSSKVLEGKEITIAYDDENVPDLKSYGRYIKEHPSAIRLVKAEEAGDFADVMIGRAPDGLKASLYLEPKRYVIGIGCRKDKEAGKISGFILEKLGEKNISTDEIRYISSIDIKQDEAGIKAFAEKNRIPFLTFPAGVLNSQKGDFNDSDFVRKQVGTGNVSERSAAAACGEGYEIITEKQARDGMTFALAKGKWRFYFE